MLEGRGKKYEGSADFLLISCTLTLNNMFCKIHFRICACYPCMWPMLNFSLCSGLNLRGVSKENREF